MPNEPELIQEVRRFWEQRPCGTETSITGEHEVFSPAWFQAIERHRYNVESCIHAVARFTRGHDKDLLEIGVGAGTDHLQWARAGARCHGVDLTDAGIECTRRHLALYGLSSHLQRTNAEQLPFANSSFDLVYSWGVIHHTEHPERIIREIHRVLRPGGRFIGMFYHRNSVNTFRIWLRRALLAGRPWRTFGDVLWHHMESLGTKAYTPKEMRALFSGFDVVRADPLITIYDRRFIPRWLARFLPDDWGWFLAVEAVKPENT